MYYLSPGNAPLGANTITYIYFDAQTGCSDTATTVITVNACTGITEARASSFLCFPNPAADQFTLQATADAGAVTVMLYDAQGRVVLAQLQANVFVEG